jgi:hypothetical protein
MEQITLRIEIEFDVAPIARIAAHVTPAQRTQIVGLMAETIVAVHRAQRASETEPVDARGEVGRDR